MRVPVPVTEDIYWVGINDFESDIFEAIWPIPEGISYNSYLIVDEKVALIDTVKSCFMDLFFKRLAQALPEGKKVDYLIINHMEPDHSGAIETARKYYPDLKIVGNKKTLEMLNSFYGVTDNTVTIGDGDTLDLGKHKLQFTLTPMVHWPETMMTYDTTTKTLFSGDAFGGFGALRGGIFDDEVDLSFYENEILRYFSNIVGKYSTMVQKAIAKLAHLEVQNVCATHGPVFRSNPKYIIDVYDKWSRYEAEKGVVVVYASMYRNTQRMAEQVARTLAEENIEIVKMHNVSRSHLSYIINDIWRYKGVVLGSCTYNTKLFPLMDSAVCALNPALMQKRVVGLFGSYSWSGGALKSLKKHAEDGKWEIVEPMIEAKSAPTIENLQDCEMLGKKVAQRVIAEV